MISYYWVCPNGEHGDLVRVGLKIDVAAEPLDGIPAPTCLIETCKARMALVTRGEYEAFMGED